MMAFWFLKAIAAIVIGFVNSVPLKNQKLDLQCDELEELCIGETYSFTCAIPDDYSYHKVSVTGGNCSYGGTVEFDVHTSNNEVLYEPFKDGNCGEVIGTSSYASGKSVIEVTFTATRHIEGATVSCLGQGISPLPYLTKTCSISLAGIPDPPRNVSISDCSSPALITWNAPVSVKTPIEYRVTVKSSLGERNITTSKRFTFVNEEDMVNKTRNYTVCIASKNCHGFSSPVCEDILVPEPEPPLAPPTLNVAIVNSTAANLSIGLNSTYDAEELCFDIERNFNVEHRCISTTQFLHNIPEKSLKGIHMFRVRASLSGIVPGEWSQPACVSFAPPLPLLFINHTIIKPGLNSNAMLNLSIEIQDDLSKLVGLCHIPQIKEVDISIQGAVQYRYQIPKSSMKHEMSFELGQEKEQQLKITAIPRSIVGPGKEQVTYVYISSAGNLARFCVNVIVGALAFSFLVLYGL